MLLHAGATPYSALDTKSLTVQQTIGYSKTPFVTACSLKKPKIQPISHLNSVQKLWLVELYTPQLLLTLKMLKV